jgi:hypothetical protein
MKRILIISLFLISAALSAQSPLLIENVDSTVTAYQGYRVPHTAAVILTVKNSSFTSTRTDGILFYGGDDGWDEGHANYYDGAKIIGNQFHGVGTGTVHAAMLGYSVNYIVAHNLFDSTSYGPVMEGDVGQTYTSGGIMYNVMKSNNSRGIGILGIKDLPVYNNTFYSTKTAGSYTGMLRILENYQVYPDHDSVHNEHTIIKNNIFYAKHNPYFISADASVFTTLECDYNLYYVEDGDHLPKFLNITTGHTYDWTEWQGLGFDAHSTVLVNPNFIDYETFVPTVRLDYGTNLGVAYDCGLATTADWVVGTYPDTTLQNGNWQVGAVLYGSGDIGGDYYVSPTGDDAATGTYAAPWLSWTKVAATVAAGDTVYFRGGQYDIPVAFTGAGYALSTSGTATDTIYFLNYPGEEPVFDFSAVISAGRSNIYGLVVTGQYMKFRGLTLRNLWQQDGTDEIRGIQVRSTSHIVFDRCKSYNMGGSGFQTYVSTDIHFNYCDAWNCVDSITTALPGNDGYGFSDLNTSNTTSSVYYYQCRAWHNGDDGFYSGSRSYAEYDQCWSFLNGLLQGGGTGFKMGFSSSYDVNLRRLYKNCVAVYNKNSGFGTNDQAYSANWMNVYNNTVYHNGYLGSSGWGYGLIVNNTGDTDAQELKRVFKNNLYYHNERGNLWLQSGALYTHEYNSADLSVTLTDEDFISIDSTGITGVRGTDGSLPVLNFLKLASTSDLINAGVDVGLAYDGSAPDLGAYEYTEATPPAVPQISTVVPHDITTVRAVTGGYMIFDGGGTISAKGICWGTDPNPALTDNVISGGTGIASFTITISGLSPKTTYHARAYATNENGTAYGIDEAFTTSQSSMVKHQGKIVKR